MLICLCLSWPAVAQVGAEREERLRRGRVWASAGAVVIHAGCLLPTKLLGSPEMESPLGARGPLALLHGRTKRGPWEPPPQAEPVRDIGAQRQEGRGPGSRVGGDYFKERKLVAQGASGPRSRLQWL